MFDDLPPTLLIELPNHQLARQVALLSSRVYLLRRLTAGSLALMQDEEKDDEE